MIVLDTNVLLKVLKPAPTPEMLRWLASQEPLAVFATTITRQTPGETGEGRGRAKGRPISKWMP